MSLHHHFEAALPAWVDSWVGHWLNARGMALDSAEHRMQMAVSLSAENVRRETGGPFGAIVVHNDTGRLVGVGVNVVTSENLSIGHAEIIALCLAQRSVGSWNLAEAGPMQLVTSCEPCSMCFGAVPWSGINSLVCGARREDAEAAGFDEGDKPENWTASLEQRGIAVRLDLMRPEAARVLSEYADGAGAIYHPGQS
ncbi:nucleoside deaminase [Elongatibacter sediminis]|uniref:Nucleoside deaminase n=1 Tax=Elongatibacter sediminis TaxID=3119006 RepID=A0AAW9RJE0_9GAMM